MHVLRYEQLIIGVIDVTASYSIIYGNIIFCSVFNLRPFFLLKRLGRKTKMGVGDRITCMKQEVHLYLYIYIYIYNFTPYIKDIA